MKNSTIVLLSGDQDSTTCLYWALQNFDHVECVSFDYGQRHKIELEFAKLNCDKLGIKHTIFNLVGLVPQSSLTDPNANSQSHFEQSKVDSSLPASFTVGRNLLFLTIAASHAYNNEIDSVTTGVCQVDYSGYPDCRSEFIKSAMKTIGLAFGKDFFKIHTPLMDLTKAKIWQLANDLGCLKEIVENTITDYNGDCSVLHPWGYGEKGSSPALDLRIEGYLTAKQNNWI